jgi:hypothetical protein
VRGLRLRIAWVMVFVALAALNFTALRAALHDPSPDSPVLTLGAMPMATVLVIGLLIGHRRLGRSPFLLGFESFGVLALALCVGLASCFREEMVGPYLGLFLDPLLKRIGQNRRWFVPIVFPATALMLGLPQLAFALLGGFLSRRFRIAERRDQTRC